MKKVTKLLLLLIIMPCSLFGQYNTDGVLYNFMENLKQNVNSVTVLNFNADKNGKQETVPYESRVFLLNSKNQITKINWHSIKNDLKLVYFYNYEDDAPNFLKQEIIEGNFVHRNTFFSYTKKTNLSGTTIFKNYLKTNYLFREFVLNNNQQITATYEYNLEKGAKSYTAYLFEYNSQGDLIKKTQLYYGKPRIITTYELNEYGDVIKELEFDVVDDKFRTRTENTYTYDKFNNWVTKKEIMKWFDDNGKVETKKSDHQYKFYTREIQYAKI